MPSVLDDFDRSMQERRKREREGGRKEVEFEHVLVMQRDPEIMSQLSWSASDRTSYYFLFQLPPVVISILRVVVFSSP